MHKTIPAHDPKLSGPKSSPTVRRRPHLLALGAPTERRTRMRPLIGRFSTPKATQNPLFASARPRQAATHGLAPTNSIHFHEVTALVKRAVSGGHSKFKSSPCSFRAAPSNSSCSLSEAPTARWRRNQSRALSDDTALLSQGTTHPSSPAWLPRRKICV